MATNGFSLMDAIANMGSSQPSAPDPRRGPSGDPGRPVDPNQDVLFALVLDSLNKPFRENNRAARPNAIDQNFNTRGVGSGAGAGSGNGGFAIDTMATAGAGNQELVDFINSPFVSDTLASLLNQPGSFRPTIKTTPNIPSSGGGRTLAFVDSRDPDGITLGPEAIEAARLGASGGPGSEGAIGFLRNILGHESGHLRQLGSSRNFVASAMGVDTPGFSQSALPIGRGSKSIINDEVDAAVFSTVISTLAEGSRAFQGDINPNANKIKSTAESTEALGVITRDDSLTSDQRVAQIMELYARPQMEANPHVNELFISAFDRELESYPGLQDAFGSSIPQSRRGRIRDLMDPRKLGDRTGADRDLALRLLTGVTNLQGDLGKIGRDLGDR